MPHRPPVRIREAEQGGLNPEDLLPEVQPVRHHPAIRNSVRLPVTKEAEFRGAAPLQEPHRAQEMESGPDPGRRGREILPVIPDLSRLDTGMMVDRRPQDREQERLGTPAIPVTVLLRYQGQVSSTGQSRIRNLVRMLQGPESRDHMQEQVRGRLQP